MAYVAFVIACCSERERKRETKRRKAIEREKKEEKERQKDKERKRERERERGKDGQREHAPAVDPIRLPPSTHRCDLQQPAL